MKHNDASKFDMSLLELLLGLFGLRARSLSHNHSQDCLLSEHAN